MEVGQARERRAAHLLLPALVLGAAAVLLAGGFRAPGSEFDEGRLLALGDRVAHGAVPYRDFESFYGPGDVYLVAGVFKLFGASLGAERAIGFVFRLLAILALVLLGRRFHPLAGVAAGAIGAMLLAGSDFAGAEYCAQATTLLGLAATAAGVSGWEESRAARWWVLGGGLLAGCSLLFRPELAPAVVLSALPLLLLRARGAIPRFCVGLVAAVLAYVPIGVVVGYGRLRRNIDDLRQTGHDRRLPIPGPTSDAGRLLVVSLAATALLLAVGIWTCRTRRRDPNARLLLGAGIFAALVVPFAFWRLGAPHIVAAGIVPMSFVPMSVYSLPPLMRVRRTALLWVATVLLLVVLLSAGAVRGGLHIALRSYMGDRIGYTVSSGGRSFVIDSRSAARDLQSVVDDLAADASPGQTLFVGPRDLRRTNSNDVFVYYLFPQLKPASFYVELDPLVSRAGSPLARDLRHADFLIQTTRWDDATEPNATRRYGSAAANEVVAAHFCLVARAGTYELKRRCR